MPFTPIEVLPGVVKSESDYAARGRWIDMDHVRFVSGKPEKIGGTQRFITDTFDGIARGATAWASYLGTQCLVFGTACSLYIYREGALSLITPYRPDATGLALATDPFAVTIGSADVTVTSAAHGITSVGTLVTFSGATAGGGITIQRLLVPDRQRQQLQDHAFGAGVIQTPPLAARPSWHPMK